MYSCINVYCQVRDKIFAFLDEGDTTLPIVPIVARVVFGVVGNEERSRTTPPFPLGTRVRKTFHGIAFNGKVTKYNGTLSDGSPQYYHVLYTDGDREDVDANECCQMARAYNDNLAQPSRTRISVGGILNGVFKSAIPAPKETLFNRAEAKYGSDGPSMGHPFTGKYDIIRADFDCIDTQHSSESELALHRYKFVIYDPHDESISTSATLKDGPMRDLLQSGDSLRLEVVSASLKHALLRVPTCVGFIEVDCNDDQTMMDMLRRKPLAVINITSLGFFHKDTQKFVTRPFASAFVHVLHRHFHLATTCTCAGLTLRCKMFGAYPLMFCAEDGLDEVPPPPNPTHTHTYAFHPRLTHIHTLVQEIVDKPWIDDTNCFVVDIVDPDEVGEEHMIPFDNMPRSVNVSAYTKQNCRDNELDPESDLTQFLLSLSHKANVGVHIDRYNTSVLDIEHSPSLDIII